jgi:hypothetical protein
MSELNQSPELSASDIDDEEYRQLIATHADSMMGQIVMQSIEGEIIASQPITFDHQKVATMLNPDADRGFSQLEDALYKDLSDEQTATLKQIQDAINNPDVDLF